MSKWFKFLFDKWVKGRCRHICLLCEYKEQCIGMRGSKMRTHDEVNHPSHYCQEGSMECIDEMVQLFGSEATRHYCLLNVWKYRKRAVYKNGDTDMKKSDWYLAKYFELGGSLID